MRHLRCLGNKIKVSLPTDEDGYTGRECPNPNCKSYFKIVFGTGLPEARLCHCPYCGHSADQTEFCTTVQIEYAKSVAFRKIHDATVKDLKELEFDIKPKGPFGIGFSMKVNAGRPYPIRLYREKQLETHIDCPNCSLKYAVYGVFAFCPDCRQHNSLQILSKNLEVVGKMLDLAGNVEPEVAGRLIENALEDCVSSFDGFGRETCRVYSSKSADPAKAEKIRFQNLEAARQGVLSLFRVDLSSGLTPDEWSEAVRCLQKRHLFEHKMGVIDERYVERTGDVNAVVGRKVTITESEVRQLARMIAKLARHVSDEIEKAK